RVQLPVLVGLYADEVLEEAGDGVHDLPLDRLDELDPVDRRALDLQYERDWELRVDVESIIGSGENPLRLHWHSPRGGVEPDADGVREVPCGFYDTENDRLSPLPPELVEIRRLATRTVDSEPDSRAAEFRLLGRLDRLLESAPAETRDMVELAGQLEDESFLAPEEVQVDFRVREDGGLELRPLVDGFDDFESAGELLDAGSDERLFKREPDDDQPVENVRVALDEPTRREVDRVRDKSEVPPDEAMDFVQQPREYLQPADELEGEIDRETERTGQSREQARQQRAERDVLNLEPVEDRIARLELDDYGDRVLGFRRSRRGNSQRDDERGVDLEGSWFESPDEPRATPPSSGNEAEESSPDVESTGGEGAPGDAAADER
ncbi:MAG: hypothetical protein ABEL76_17155, partial [Bradymonadaceae bacterium]